MNLGTAIQRADERKDKLRRNHLIRIALANDATYRDIALLLKRSVSTIHSYTGHKERVDPLAMPVSTFEGERSAA